jgi:Flp pilus assembly protein TadD
MTKLVCALILAAAAAAQPPAAITVDYPPEGAVFPPEFPPPTFLWHDAAAGAVVWVFETENGMRAISRGERMRLGRIDPRTAAPTNKPPAPPPGHSWTPDAAAWAAIKNAGQVTITGYRDANATEAVSRGQVTIHTSRDPVGAPIFYRDVPLMPSEGEKGVIKPLAATGIPLIAWRLRDVGRTDSRVLMEGIHSCANCHSFSRDGKTMGMDVDGPGNDKGLYALVPVKPQMAIRKEEVIAWSTFRGKLGGRLRVGFMSQVSPDGQYVVTTINDPGEEQSEYRRRKNPLDLILNYYVANFKDYRFLQVFYPTRGILAWYNRAAGVLQPLAGADDPRYVHTTATWSPDGKYLVFSRAEAKDAYLPDGKMAAFANDPAETQIRYDLYRIPFNEGRGGRAEPIAGASQNGMSNSFPKISPDGRWIVFVQARNGQLMRPDSKLYIVPAAGGQARLMRCNTPLMNSWHSFSPNGRWLVFSSKSRSPYTQMFLTHLDEQGHDSPAILIENATAANRAVNIPEFVNIPPDGMLKIDAPVTDYYRVVDVATDLLKKRQFEAAVKEWSKALALNPAEAPVHNNLGLALAETGRTAEAINHYRKALELSPDYPEAHNNLAEALSRTDRIGEAIPHLQKAIQLMPGLAELHRNLAMALAVTERVKEAIPEMEQAVRLSGGKDPAMLEMLAALYADVGRTAEAEQARRRANEARKK